MQQLFDAINTVCQHIKVVSDFLWGFPTNFQWYSNIPILGNFSLAILLLLGSGIFFSFRLCFVQVRYFKCGLKLLSSKHNPQVGISPLASFLLSAAMRVGPGNILGVTGAIAVGGPGALFWMWVSAFFGMSTAFVEATMAQIFKEKKNDEYVGGLSFYGRRLLRSSAVVGAFLSIVYIIYALLCFPAQGFNVISAVGRIASTTTGNEVTTYSPIYFTSFAIMMFIVIAVTFGGIKSITKLTDKLVPIMAIIYILTVIILAIMNINRVPYFFNSVFSGAFKQDAIFGGIFGTVLIQGFKRGLMSNEAGQGTITMAAASSNAKHPCEQGFIQSLGVFLDTIIICTLSGFVVIMGHSWLSQNGNDWFELDNLPKFLVSANELTPNSNWNIIVTLLITVCFGMFAFTSLLGFMSFTEIRANRISTKKVFINCIRVLCLFVISFGVMTSIVGLDLSSLWNLSDFANIIIAYCNIPLLYIGFKYVKKALKHYDKYNGEGFCSKVLDIDLPVWDEINKKGDESTYARDI